MLSVQWAAAGVVTGGRGRKSTRDSVMTSTFDNVAVVTNGSAVEPPEMAWKRTSAEHYPLLFCARRIKRGHGGMDHLKDGLIETLLTQPQKQTTVDFGPRGGRDTTASRGRGRNAIPDPT